MAPLLMLPITWRKQDLKKFGMMTLLNHKVSFPYSSLIIMVHDSWTSKSYFLDPDELKIIAIARREADFALAKQKEAEAATKTEAEKPKTDFSDIELEKIDSSEDLEKLGLDYLKFLLQLRKLKCGGTLTDRAKRLFSVKNLTPEQYPKKIKAK